MSATNLELVTAAYQKCNVIDETQSPSAEQGVVGLSVLNDMMAAWVIDGITINWYPQTDLAATSPLQAKDVEGVKFGLTARLSTHYGLTLGELLLSEIGASYQRLIKRSLRYSDANLSELPRGQGTTGAPGW